MKRCRYWPDCRNEDVCPWHHPTKICANFPNCWFGDKCLYIHPKCRFGLNCTKLNCQFSHYSTTPTNAAVDPKIASKAIGFGLVYFY